MFVQCCVSRGKGATGCTNRPRVSKRNVHGCFEKFNRNTLKERGRNVLTAGTKSSFVRKATEHRQTGNRRQSARANDDTKHDSARKARATYTAKRAGKRGRPNTHSQKCAKGRGTTTLLGRALPQLTRKHSRRPSKTTGVRRLSLIQRRAMGGSALTGRLQGIGKGQLKGSDPSGCRIVSSTTPTSSPAASPPPLERSLTASTSASLLRSKSPRFRRLPHLDLNEYIIW